jgi:farnesol kinase
MCYFHFFGFIEESWIMAVAFLVASLAAAIVESLPVSTRLDDNLTVPITSALVGGLAFNYVGGGDHRSGISAIAEMIFTGSS